MKHKLLILFIAFILLVGCGKIPIEENSENIHLNCKLDRVVQEGETRGLVEYDGVKHDYILDLPQIVDGAPLIVMLHGYGGSADAFRRDIALEKEALASGYAVVYLSGAPSPEDTTAASGWNSGIGNNSNKDVDFLCAMVNDLCETYGFDRNRIYAVGFSNGAFMAHRLAVEADDTFKAVVCVAGMMPESVWNLRPDTCKISVFQVTGEKDDVIPKNMDGSAKYAKAPAIEEVMDYYVKGNDLPLTVTESIGKNAALEKHYADHSSRQIWHLYIPEGRHSWPEEAFVGFSMNQVIMEFLETQG